MCGIVGAFRAGGLEPGPLQQMQGSLAHRGPDGEGSRAFGPIERPWAVIGTRRLAIVDPAGGEQPMSDPSGRWWLSCNGEIYNHAPLRKELQANSVPFRTHSDTEVALTLLSTLPVPRALTRMDGMFALALVDVERRRLVLARDRLGVKPLYWALAADGTVLFASELRALRRHPALGFREDTRALQSLLLWEYIPTPWTPWRGIHKLEPGTWLEVDADGIRQGRWWTPPVPEGGEGGNLERWARSVYGAVQVATFQRMSADVPVGYLLSGGLDSSFVTAIAQKRQRDPVQTFSVAVDAPGFDEGPAARAVAASLGTMHRELRFGPEDLGPTLELASAHMDEPLADSSLMPSWRLFELVREAGLKAVISGDGGDEAFAGYPTLRAHQLAELVSPGRALLQGLADRLPVSLEGVSPDYMAKRFAAGLGLPWARRHQVWMGAWLPDELGVGADDPVWSVVDAHASAAEGADPASRALYLDQRLYLSDGVLVKVDRASMAHGVEVRSPYLDRGVIELAASIPLGHKLHARESKVVLRRAAEGLLPPETLQRKKQGFGAPVGPWLRGPCASLTDGVEDVIADLVPPERWRRAVAEHREGRADHRRRLWSGIILARWRQGPHH